jgi:hypothetical protein
MAETSCGRFGSRGAIPAQASGHDGAVLMAARGCLAYPHFGGDALLPLRPHAIPSRSPALIEIDGPARSMGTTIQTPMLATAELENRYRGELFQKGGC